MAQICILLSGGNVTDAADLSVFVTVRSLTSDMFIYCVTRRSRSVSDSACGVSRGTCMRNAIGSSRSIPGSLLCNLASVYVVLFPYNNTL